jgi:hypothetical protein
MRLFTFVQIDRCLSDGQGVNRKRTQMTRSRNLPTRELFSERVQYLHPTAYWLLHEFIVWNDICRYPDLPSGNSKLDHESRNRINKLQIKHAYGPLKRSIMLHLWALIFETHKDAPTLRKVVSGMLNPLNNFIIPDGLKTKLIDTEEFFNGQGTKEIFEKNRNKFIAHVESIAPSVNNQVEDQSLYRLIPKAIYLSELLHFELLGFPDHNHRKFKSLSEQVAPMFHHTRPDELLTRLFLQRSSPAADYNKVADELFIAFRKREHVLTRR